MSLPYIVQCARCGEDWPENDDAVTWRDGDWVCTYEDDCDARVWGADAV